MNIVWLTINSSYSHSSLALPLIHQAACSTIQWEWSHVEGTINDKPMELVQQVCRKNPDLLCCPLYLFNRSFALDVLKRLKLLRPLCKIAVGGPEVLGIGTKNLLLQVPEIDYVCRGEGEVSVPALLANQLGTAVATRDTAEQLWQTVAPLYDSWATLSMPEQDEFYDKSKPFVQLETARGCPNGCIFCTSTHTQVRFKPLELVRQELDLIQHYKIKEVRLLDRSFNMPPDRAAALLKIFREEYPDIRFHLELHPLHLNDELMEQLALAHPGKLHIEVGIQSLNDQVLKAIGRLPASYIPKETPLYQPYLDALHKLQTLTNLEIHSDLLLGCPLQTWESLLDDVQHLLKLRIKELQLEVLKVLPGTPLHQHASELGVHFSPCPPYDVMETASLSMEKIQRGMMLSKLLDGYANNEFLADAFAAADTEGNFIESFLDFLADKGFFSGGMPHLKQRFLWFSDYLSAARNLDTASCTTAKQMAAIGWLKAGFPPGQGAAQEGFYVNSLPDNAQFLEGMAEAIQGIHAKIVCLPAKERNTFFVYDRSLAPNRSLALYQENKQ